MSDERETCPACHGLGEIIIRKNTGNRYRDHPNRTLPLDYYCPECEQFVTISHQPNYRHKIYQRSEQDVQ